MARRRPSEPDFVVEGARPRASVSQRRRSHTAKSSASVAHDVASPTFAPETSLGVSAPVADASIPASQGQPAAGTSHCPGASVPGLFPHAMSEGPELDRRIGIEIRRFRTAADLRLVDLAAGLGISQQQLMKYELGRNRVAASRLWQIAELLKVDVRMFFR